jgi:mono/diheme cytochrome c family protein
VQKLTLFSVVLIVLSLAACSPALDKEQLATEGEDLYVNNCARCHQVTGEGTELFPALAGNPVVTLDQPAPMIDVVMNGRGSMPSFRGVLTDQQAAALLTYIRNAWGNEADLVTPKQTR